jgi:hypothetical protein
VANFVKRLNKGTNGRYRGKLPLICFNCDGIGHFANKCPHKKKINDEGYSKGRQTYKGKRTTKKVFKKKICTKEDISSSDEDEVSDSETGRVLFMAVEDSDMLSLKFRPHRATRTPHRQNRTGVIHGTGLIPQHCKRVKKLYK